MHLKEHIEKIKTGAIVLLSVSAVILMAKSGLLEQFAPAPGESTVSVEPKETHSLAEIVTEPLFIVIGNGEAGRCGIKYEGEKLNEAFDELSIALGEALGSAGEPEPISTDQWERCLLGNSIFFDYYYDRDLSLIAEGLGVETVFDTETARTSAICLAEDGGVMTLCYLDADSGQAYRCETALDFDRVSFVFSLYPPNGAAFAFELPDSIQHLAPYTVILNTMPEIRRVTSRNTLYNDYGVERLLRLLEINTFVASRYTESDGTEVYVEGGAKILRLDGDGIATFRQSSGEGARLSLGGEKPTKTSVAKAAWELMSAGVGIYSGEARLEISRLDYDAEKDEYTVTFDYVLNGIPVRSASGRGAAELKVEQGYISSLVMWFRGFSIADGVIPVLPERQAAAVAEALEGERLLLIYEDTGESVTAKWVTAR